MDKPPIVPSKKPRQAKTAARGYDSKHHKKTRAELIKKFPLCQRCGQNWSHHLHHKDRDTFNRNPENLEMLCEKCHRNEHK